MSAQITVTKDNEIAVMKVIGHPTVQDLLEVNKRLAEGGEFVVGGRLWDFRESRVDFTREELAEIASVSNRLGQRSSKVAILVGSDLTFGLSRMYQVFRESDHTAVSVFRDETEAMRWLLLE